MIAKWAQEDVETLDNLLNNNVTEFCTDCVLLLQRSGIFVGLNMS